ncbi:unnamed protein product [Orchesella dallaii]|uniref:Uncharacterized protein n=1 Tax=Orchesella dallaii TaxID=48710 RepID=A0ABP1QEJ1_9HEXA
MGIRELLSTKNTKISRHQSLSIKTTSVLVKKHINITTAIPFVLLFHTTCNNHVRQDSTSALSSFSTDDKSLDLICRHNSRTKTNRKTFQDFSVGSPFANQYFQYYQNRIIIGNNEEDTRLAVLLLSLRPKLGCNQFKFAANNNPIKKKSRRQHSMLYNNDDNDLRIEMKMALSDILST